jgi:hypothetical protein
VLLVGLAGRGATPHYLERLVGTLAPRAIVPMHFDWFFAPLDDGVRLLPRVDFAGFAAEARAVAPSAALLAPEFGETLAVPAGDPHAASFTTGTTAPLRPPPATPR